MIKANFYTTDSNCNARCLLCPKMCIIKSGELGYCMARINIDGILYSRNYFKVAAANIDPIEKKPLYHYKPGSKTFSIGAYGCNMRCNFCQNHTISISDRLGEDIQPESIISSAQNYNCSSIAYTYTEPTVWYEFIHNMSLISKSFNIKNIMVTNGNINPKPLQKLLPLIDAANIDIKTFSDELYQSIGGSLKSTGNTIKSFFEAGTHIEISSLIVPDMWNEYMFENMCEWLANINQFIPLHINRYFPAYKCTLSPTKNEMLTHFKNIADKYLKYVYIGNIDDENTSNTVCHECGETLIKRRRYNTKILLSENKCLKCASNIPIHL